jgi:Domain of unknown function (DUF4386)
MEFQLNKTSIRIAGFLYLLVAIGGLFAEFFVRTKLIVQGNAAATAANIAGSEGLYRMGIAADVLCQISHFLLVLLLYILFRHIHRNMALLMLACVIASVAMTLLNLTHQANVLLLLDGGALNGAFNREQIEALVMLSIRQHNFGYALGGVFFGLWLYPLGHLMNQSGRFPRILGTLLKIGCFGYLIDTFVAILVPRYRETVMPVLMVAAIAELATCFYWLLAGLRAEKTGVGD